jgi:predicted phosphate transport protein (TIGR00153 family)
LSGVGEYFSSIFGKSPFRPIQQHMGLCMNAASEVVNLVTATMASDFAEVERLQRLISSLEGQADELKREIRLNLPRGFLLPVARADVLDLLTRQDKIANHSEDIAGLILGRQMTFPEELKALMDNYTRVSVSACGLALDVVNEIDELIESSFTGKEARQVVEMIAAVELRERESDKLQVDLRRALFQIEKNLGAVDVMFLYTIIDLVGDLADIAERVGHRVQMMLAK